MGYEERELVDKGLLAQGLAYSRDSACGKPASLPHCPARRTVGVRMPHPRRGRWMLLSSAHLLNGTSISWPGASSGCYGPVCIELCAMGIIKVPISSAPQRGGPQTSAVGV